MKNKGQITMFIILGIVIVILAGTLYFIYNGGQEEEYETGISAASIKAYTESCINDVASTGIYKLADQGGFIYSFPQTLNTEYQSVAYHSYDGRETGPTEKYMEEELSKFIEDSLEFCLKGYDALGEYEFKIGNPEITTDILDSFVTIKAKYPITIKDKTRSIELNNFEGIARLKLGKALKTKEEIIDEFKDQTYIDLTYLSKTYSQINLFPYDKNTIIYSIDQNENTISENPLTFNFAVKENGNSPPEIEFLPDFVLNVGEQFTYQLRGKDSDGDEIQYFSKDEEIGVNSATGMIIFTPTKKEERTVEFCVKDIQDQTTCRKSKLMIQNE